jgi:hypothetical protein
VVQQSSTGLRPSAKRDGTWVLAAAPEGA